MNGKQKRYLRGLGHNVKAAFQIGKDGLTNSILSELGDYLEKNEIGKLHVLKNCEMSKDNIVDLLTKNGIEVVQTIGNMIIIY